MDKEQEKKEYVYNCEKCDFHTNAKSLYEKHLITGKHQTGKRLGRCDKKFTGICPECEYKTDKSTNMTLHMLNNHSTREKRENEFKFYCTLCDFGAFTKLLYDKHLNSEKHKLIENATKANIK